LWKEVNNPSLGQLVQEKAGAIVGIWWEVWIICGLSDLHQKSQKNISHLKSVFANISSHLAMSQKLTVPPSGSMRVKKGPFQSLIMSWMIGNTLRRNKTPSALSEEYSVILYKSSRFRLTRKLPQVYSKSGDMIWCPLITDIVPLSLESQQNKKIRWSWEVFQLRKIR
jgi:hypothetical protein